MTDATSAWHRRSDVAWIGDEARVIAARTSRPDRDGPRILEGAAASLWLQLAGPQTAAQLIAQFGHAELIDQALTALSDAGLIEPA